MDRSEAKVTLGILYREWTWRKLDTRRGIEKLIYTDLGYGYRKDMRVVQNVGRPIVKFRFDIGPYLGGTVTSTPTHFSISTMGTSDRIKWMAMPGGDLFIRQRKGKSWQKALKVNDFFDDVSDIQDGELDLLEVLMPGAIQELPKLLPGLLGVDAALEERFYGNKFGS